MVTMAKIAPSMAEKNRCLVLAVHFIEQMHALSVRTLNTAVAEKVLSPCNAADPVMVD